MLGENGAGKSTLMKIIYGAVRPDEGEIRWNGEPVQIASPAAARALGISMVYQHFSLFDTLTAAENVWLGLDKSLSLADVIARIREVAGVYGLDVDPLRPVHTLSVGERQRVEIVRALMTEPKLLILDEPTSVLTPQAVQTLFVTLRKLAAEGCSILYIWHKLDEIRALCHHCTVLRGGKVTGEVDPTQETNASLSRLMIGAEPPQLQHREPHPGARRARRARPQRWPRKIRSAPRSTAVSFEVRAGEVVGIAGVSGNGQQELMARALGRGPARAGAARSSCSSTTSRAHRRAGAAPAGLHFVPEERLGRGAVPTLSLAQNTLLTRTARGRRRRLAQASRRRHGARRGADPALQRQGRRPGLGGEEPVGRQPAEVHRRPRDRRRRPSCSIVSQPTWGVDVGAAAQIRGELLALRDDGCAVLVVSEELDELFEICDRLVVIARAASRRACRPRQATIERIGEWMSGLWDRARRGEPCSSLRRAREPSRAMSIASPLIALAITVVIGTLPVRAARQGSAARAGGVLRRAAEERLCAHRARGQGDAAAPDRARPGGLLSLQRLEHRRRRPVHRRRDRRQRRGDAGDARRPAAGSSSP